MAGVRAWFRWRVWARVAALARRSWSAWFGRWPLRLTGARIERPGRLRNLLSFVAASDLPPSANVVRELAQLAAAGVRVRLVAEPGTVRGDHPFDCQFAELVLLNPDWTDEARHWVARFAARHPLRVINTALYVAGRADDSGGASSAKPGLFRRALLLARVADEVGAEQLHTGSAGEGALVAMLAANLVRLPYSVQVGDDACDDSSRGCRTDVLGRATTVLTRTQYGVGVLREELGRAGAPITVVGDGVDLSVFFQGDEEPHPPVGNLPVVLSVGRLEPASGYAHLLTACAALRRRGVRFRCEIIGGEMRQAMTCAVHLYKQHRMLGLEESLRFRGDVALADRPACYRQASVVVFPAVDDADRGRIEAPPAIMEAMAMGKPVIASRVGAIPELVGEDGEAGILVPPGDEARLVDAIEQALTDETWRCRAGAAARARAKHLFNFEKNVAAYIDAFVRAGTDRTVSAHEPEFGLAPGSGASRPHEH